MPYSQEPRKFPAILDEVEVAAYAIRTAVDPVALTIWMASDPTPPVAPEIRIVPLTLGTMALTAIAAVIPASLSVLPMRCRHRAGA